MGQTAIRMSPAARIIIGFRGGGLPSDPGYLVLWHASWWRFRPNGSPKMEGPQSGIRSAGGNRL
jgi:hypothetical protein